MQGLPLNHNIERQGPGIKPQTTQIKMSSTRTLDKFSGRYFPIMHEL